MREKFGAFRGIGGLRARLRTPAEEAEVLTALVVQQTLSGHYKDAIVTACEALERLGVTIPGDGLDLVLQTELNRFRKLLAGRTAGDLIAVKDATSPEVILSLRLLARVCPLCYIANPALCRVVTTIMVNLSLAEGHTPESALGYAFLGMVHSSTLQLYEDSYALGRLAIDLAEKYSDASQACKTTHMFCGFISHWSKHLRDFDPINRLGFQAGLQSGELQYAGYHQYNRSLCLFHLGTRLDKLMPELEDLARFGTRTRNQHATDPISATMRAVSDLKGDPSDAGSFALNDRDDSKFLEDLTARDARPAMCHFNVMRSQVLYLYGQFDRAEQLADLVEANLSYVQGHFAVAVHAFYAALIAIAQIDRGVTQGRRERTQRWHGQLKQWAAVCPDNFLHKTLLVEAELTRIDGDGWHAAELYDRAIFQAGKNHYLQEEALGRELAGRFWIAQGRRKIAALYLSEAHQCYRLWGASRKASMVSKEHHSLIGGAPTERQPDTSTSIPFFTIASSTGAALDFANVMEANRALSKEVAVDSLVKKLVKLAVEAAGAQRGHLLQMEEGRFVAVASSAFDRGEVSYAPARAPISIGILPTIVNYVSRTKTILIVADVSGDSRFAGDDAIHQNRPRSVLCLPITSRGATSSILYLEHSLTTEAFTPDRVEILQSLAAQASVSLENARLYEQQEHRAGELREALGELQQLKTKLEGENEYLQKEIRSEQGFGDIIGESSGLRKVMQQIQLVAPTDAAVLINGESGTGKELVARAIHENSPRKGRALIKVNCGAVPETLFESEFFGHMRGAFTGAVRDKPGRFELADGGTLFLDEIGEIPLAMQSKLLRVLQEQEIERVGDTRTRKISVRIIAATNRDLKKDVEAGRFRQDLFYRLAVFPLEIPPLRERREDIAQLAAHFVRVTARKMNRPPPRFTETQAAQLTAHDWPGNVRELQNCVERAIIVSRGGQLHFNLTESKPTKAADTENSSPTKPALLTREELKLQERANILDALKQTQGKIFGPNGAAQLLGMKPTTLASRIKALRIQLNGGEWSKP